jgi:hypothetical protein
LDRGLLRRAGTNQMNAHLAAALQLPGMACSHKHLSAVNNDYAAFVLQRQTHTRQWCYPAFEQGQAVTCTSSVRDVVTFVPWWKGVQRRTVYSICPHVAPTVSIKVSPLASEAAQLGTTSLLTQQQCPRSSGTAAKQHKNLISSKVRHSAPCRQSDGCQQLQSPFAAVCSAHCSLLLHCRCS